MSDSRESDFNQETGRFLAQRAIEPDASELAEKIILASQNLPQEIAKPIAGSVWRTQLRPFFTIRLFSTQSLFFSSAIACLMVAVMAGLWFMPHSGIVKPQSITQNISVDGDALSEEFSWESLLIMEDELAFAEL
ncbi:MAG: hypothetical protein ACI9WC_000057 [Arenicella sp.]|jgi:hypothetical protein